MRGADLIICIDIYYMATCNRQREDGEGWGGKGGGEEGEGGK